MELSIFLIIIGFIVLMQAAIPFLLKRTIAFGVTIPEGHTDDATVASYKKIYSMVVFFIGIIALATYYFWAQNTGLSGERIVMVGLALQFGILFLSMGLYLYFHAKTTKLKRLHDWGKEKKQVRIADLAIRAKDEMLPAYFFALPMLITVGLIAYTLTQYSAMPDMIPTHWGPDGLPDQFKAKSYFSVIALLIILLVVQGMMLAINTFIKQSGIRLNAAKSNTSKAQQLLFRKYSSWFLFIINLLLTILFGFLQLTTIHDGLANEAIMLAMPLGFLLIVLIATGAYAFKVGQSGSRIKVEVEDEIIPGITNADDDEFWKLGAIYINRNDPSIFVEKRFGVGWTINFGHPLSYCIMVGPVLLILLISFLL